MSEEIKVTKGAAVCYWLSYGQPYSAKVDEVYEQVGAGGGPTVDLTFGEGPIDHQRAFHVQYNPEMHPNSYCLPGDPGWPGTLPKPAAGDEEATTEPGVAMKAEKAEKPPAVRAVPK